MSSPTESHERPVGRQAGACSGGSNTALFAGMALPQESNLKDPMRVRQLLVGLYMPVNQNVQSSTGSIDIAA